jgi:hypothetical protein
MRTTSLLLLLLLPISAEARSPRERVELSLMAYESVPNREALLRITPDVAQVLREIVERPSPRALARNRAISVLQLFPSAATTATLLRVIQRHALAREGIALLELQRAISSLAVAAGPRALTSLQPFLAHPSPDIRYETARAVALTRSPQARSLLEKRRLIEPSPMVRQQIERQVQLLKR